MKIITYSEAKDLLERSPDNKAGHDYVNRLGWMEKLKEKYGDTPYAIPRSSLQLPLIAHYLGRKLEGKRVLDLGCGNNSNYDMLPTSRLFEPWLCRTLKIVGASPIGVDLGDLSQEEFEHKSELDLLEKDCLSFLPDRSIDFVNMVALLNSPTFENVWFSTDRRAAMKGPFLENPMQKALLDNLRPQLERIVKPEGTFIYTPFQ